ncbi:hypothetical protein SK128_028192 [Halocaridina rubra]|uniref:NACHT domain-containing protein n=1 Tax=Halocaridina rubra TaxID=373956 RepID=A0AAN9A3F3_HALRR
MASSSDIFVTYRLNYTRYARFIYTIGPKIIVQAFKWLFVGGSTSLKEYYENHPSQFADISKTDLKIIRDGKKVEKMDVTLLFKLLQRICDLALPNNPVWWRLETGAEKPLEYSLYQLKQLRNDLTHPDPTNFLEINDQMLNDHMMKLETLYEEVLVLAAKKVQVSEDEMKAAVQKMKKDIRRERYSEESVSDEEFINICKEELRNRSAAWPLTESYVPPRMRQELTSTRQNLNAKGSSHFEELSSQVPETSREFTSHDFLLFLTKSWLRNCSEVKRLQEYELLLPLHCNAIITRDVQLLLRATVIPSSAATFDVAQLVNFLRRNKILWILDGWDESTREATGLINFLAKSLDDLLRCHTLLITSRPQFTDKLRQILKEPGILTFSLAGFNYIERCAVLEHKTNGTQSSGHMSPEIFFQSISRIAENITDNLKNPLKFVLMHRLWQEDPNILNVGHTFTHLYIALKDAFKKILINDRLCELFPNKKTAEEQVMKWLEVLYKSAFNSILNFKSLMLSEADIEMLSANFDPFFASHCLSTFLEYCSPEEIISEKRQYAFYHATQQCVYASLYIRNAIAESPTPEKEIDRIFQRVPSKYEFGYALDSVLGAYDILHQQLSVFMTVVSKITNGEIWHHKLYDSLAYEMKLCFKKLIDLFTNIYSEQMVSISNKNQMYFVLVGVLEIQAAEKVYTSFPSKSISKLIHLSLEETGNTAPWFEALRISHYNEELLKEVSYYINRCEWYVRDHEIKAAWELLSYTMPEKICVHISGDPKMMPDLDILLFIISKRKLEVQVVLQMHYQCCCSSELSNKYLHILCNISSKCKLTMFAGHLDSQCFNALCRATTLKKLSLRLMDQYLFQQLPLLVHRFKNLKYIVLTYDMKIYHQLQSSLQETSSRALIVDINVPHMNEIDMQKSFALLIELSRQYNSIYVGYLDDKRLSHMSSCLSKNRVEVDHLYCSSYLEGLGRYVHMRFGQISNNISVLCTLGKQSSDTKHFKKKHFNKVKKKKDKRKRR